MKRLAGIDVARSLAIAGMLAAHFLELDSTGGSWRFIARVVNGKAMPLFVFLGGVGFTLLVERARHRVVTVVGRAAFLLVAGLVMTEHVPLIAVILHFYALYFLVGLVVHKLPSALLLLLALAVMIAGALTWQRLAPGADGYRGWEGWDTITDPLPLLTELAISGLYPLLPSYTFFAVGMWTGRLALADRRVVVRLGTLGLALTVAGYGIGGWAEQRFTDRGLIERRNGVLVLTAEASELVTVTGLRDVDAEVARTGESRRRILEDHIVVAERLRKEAPILRWLDTSGHGNMPAWVVGATGLSLVVLALCSLAVMAAPRALAPLAAAGRLALTLYVAQGLVLRWWYPRHARSNGYVAELWFVAAMFVAFVALATLWTWRFRVGPIEAMLRLAGDPGALRRRRRARRD